MTDYTFTLYHYPLTASVRVKWLLHEILGEDFDTRVSVRKVALLRGEQYTPEFLARNPNHAVPVLEITAENEAFRMFESGAMLTFLADAFPEHGLAPPAQASAARAAYLQRLETRPAYGAAFADRAEFGQD